MKEKMTPIEYLKSYLGVVDGEEFDIYYDGKDVEFNPYHFKDENLYDKDNIKAHSVLGLLVKGTYEVKKRPFVPKYDETYYFVEGDEIFNTRNTFNTLDFALIKCGWVFRTREEALANKERVMREIKEVVGE